MNESPPPKRHFHEELDLLQARLLEMGGLVEDLLARAVEAFLQREVTGREELRTMDRRVDALEVEIDECTVELLALQQPMASDLRQIFATLKISNDLERVGDHASNIVKAAARMAEHPAFPELPEIEEMGVLTRRMLADALTAYTARDALAARDVCARDDRVDDLRRSIQRILVSYMLERPRWISPALEHLRVSQQLERIADLSTNISEDVVFLVEGKSIKHHAEGPPPGSGA